MSIQQAIARKLEEKREDPLPPIRQRTAIRQAAGLAQSDLADVIGVSQATVSRWESGRREPTIKRHRSARALEALKGGPR